MAADPTSRLTAKCATAEENLIRLSADDQRRFAQALIAPPAPTAALKRAKRLHRANVAIG